MSRVDVIIPCYKYAHYLRDCVESVLSQPVDVRVLIVDDASPDDTPAVAAELTARDGRVEYRRHARNMGHIATYNEGLEWSSGDYTVLLSADDLLAPGALGRAAGLMDAHPEVGLVYGRAVAFESGAGLPEPRGDAVLMPAPRVQSGASWLEYMCRDGGNPLYSPEVVTRTRLQNTLGGYRADLPSTADLEMWLRFAAHSDVGILDADQAYYRLHGKNMHHEYSGTRDLRQVRDAFGAVFREHGARVPEGRRLEEVAHRTMARHALWAASEALDRGAPVADRHVLDLIDFARETYGGVGRLREFWGVRLRQQLGVGLVARLRRAPGRRTLPGHGS